MGKKDNGFTLIEVLIALAIFSIGLLAAASLLVTATRQNTKTTHLTLANGIAQQQMETLLAQDLDPWPTAQVTGATNNPVVMGQAYTGYSVNWSITPDTPTTNIATVVVTVSYPNQRFPVVVRGTTRRDL